MPNCWVEMKVAPRQGWDFHKPELLTQNLLDPLKRKKPTRILVNFSGDLFGTWVDGSQLVPRTGPCSEWKDFGGRLDALVEQIVYRSPHTFLFLTKRPDRIWKIQWPDNCWMGATVCNQKILEPALCGLSDTQCAKRFLSIEPMLEKVTITDEDLEILDWLVIGAQTQPEVQPKIEWVKEIVEACDRVGVKVWLKDNLIPLFWVNGVKDHVCFPPWATERGVYRQEVPDGQT